jgi:cellulose biosynthesis protein BcsQ
MKSITIFNNKGGVGKTTFLCNLAAHLSINEGKRVLVLDADPQCNATIYLLPEDRILEIYDKRSRDTVDWFLDPLRRGKGYSSGEPDVETSERFEVALIPGDPRLALSEDLLAADWTSGNGGEPRGLQTTFVFQDLMQRYEDYDYIFVDVGPSLGAINRAVLLASDFFIMPMSSDIFSLMAIQNIARSLTTWQRGLEKGLSAYKEEEGSDFDVAGESAHWHLSFAGYVTQQYTAKMTEGRRRPVKAYERILRRAPGLIDRELVQQFSDLPADTEYRLGEIPNLHSVVPMSQTANAPIFALRGKDGVVGAHFTKVSEAGSIYAGISKALHAVLGE